MSAPSNRSTRARLATSTWKAVVFTNTSTGVVPHHRRVCPSRSIVARSSPLQVTPAGSAARTSPVRDVATKTLRSMSIVPRARCVHQASASAPRTRVGSDPRRARRWIATILSGE